ncbi:zonular occludens toxin domain-containing protein [Burkholderia stagnalis]
MTDICIGHIRGCDRSAPEEDNFFPGEEALDKPVPIPDPEFGRVWGGDLVVIDEATRYWSQGEKIKRPHAYFFREHRHFTNVMGHSCDLVVIDPDLTMLARALKGKIEMSSVTHKPKALGLNRYSVNLYRGVKFSAKPMSSTWRILGRFESDSVQYVVLGDSSGRMRVNSPAAFNGLGSAIVGHVDGERVSMWSGAKPAALSVPIPGGIGK